MTVNLHPLVKDQCVADLCDYAAESVVVIAPASPAGATTCVRLCELHAFSVFANSEEARELLFAAQDALVGIPEDAELRNRIRSYLDLD